MNEMIGLKSKLFGVKGHKVIEGGQNNRLKPLQSDISSTLKSSHSDPVYDQLTSLSARISRSQICQIIMVKSSGTYYVKSKFGTASALLADSNCYRRDSFLKCILMDDSPDVFVVLDATKNPRFSNLKSANNSHSIEFYAGMFFTTHFIIPKLR